MTKTQFQLTLKLQPSPEGLRQLQNWPKTPFSPDFAVAASGLIQLKIGDKFIGARDGKIFVGSPFDKTLNFWLPDYLGGFATNLGQAALKLHKGAKSTKAGFIDEPVALNFQRQPDEYIQIQFEAEGQTIQAVSIPLSNFYHEIARTLRDFQQQLIAINPKLSNEPEVREMAMTIRQLLEKSNK